jgi:putative oxidoreductase
MSLARRAARAAVAASFISGGIDQIRNPQPKAAPASPIAKPIADRVPQLPNDPESLVKLDGAIKVVGGLGLIVGPFARPAALLLAGSLVPTTLAGHRFWETSDPDQRASDRVEFFKNVSLLGGLLITALDTGGRPSVPWMAGKAAHGAAEAVGDAAGSVGEAVTGAAGAVTGAASAVAHGAGKAVGGGSPSLSKRAQKSLAKAEKRSAALVAVAEAQTAKALAKRTSGQAASKGGAALGAAQAKAGSALGAAQALSGRALRKADKAAAKAQRKRRKSGPVVADAARTAAAATREGAHTAKEGLVAAKDKLAAAV